MQVNFFFKTFALFFLTVMLERTDHLKGFVAQCCSQLKWVQLVFPLTTSAAGEILLLYFFLPLCGESCLFNIYVKYTNRNTHTDEERQRFLSSVPFSSVFWNFKAYDKDCRGPKKVRNNLSITNHSTTIPCWFYPSIWVKYRSLPVI